MDKRTLAFSLPTGQKTIKLFTLHPRKPWVAVVTYYNSFSLWNYQQKILIRSFNCNTLDESGSVDVKDLVFYDKHCLSYQNESLVGMKSHIIFVTNSKIFFYDYITDGIKQINQTQIEKKNIKKVCPYSQTKICVGLSDGSLKLYDNRETPKNSMAAKAIKGYHTRPITHLFTYSQNANEAPRVISVSANDGLIACWNIQTIMSNANSSETCNPSFKLQSPTQAKSQQIRSLQYDKETYKLLTATDNFVSIWNTMTGLELKRIKCQIQFKQMLFFNHLLYGQNSFLSFIQGSLIQILKITSFGKFSIIDEINLKNLVKQNHLLSIRHIFNWASNPSELFVQIESGLISIQISPFYRPIFGFNNSFITRLTTINSKDFIIKAKNQTRINPDSTPQQARNAKFQEGSFFNCFFLSLEDEWVHFNLIEIQIKDMLHERKKYKFFKRDVASFLFLKQSPQSIIDVSFDGKSLIVFNRTLFCYQIYSMNGCQDTENLLDMHQNSNSMDFYSKFELITKGVCRDIVWHQYKNQYAAICPFDKNGQLVSFQKQKQKKGIFGRPSKQENSMDKILNQTDNWCACIFVFTKKSKKYLMIEKSKPIKSTLNRILNLGNIFCYSSQEKNTTETIQCISQDQALIKQVEGIGSFPLRIYLSYCETYQIFVYQAYFIVFKIQQNGFIAYHSTIHQKVIEGMFWDKFFIFCTKNEIYFLQLLASRKILIKIAQMLPNYALQKNKTVLQNGLIDDLQPEVSLMPQGQLQLLTIVNYHLLAVNQCEQIVLLSLNNNPYIQFCIELVCGASEKVSQIYRRSSLKVRQIMKQSILQYGLTVPQIDTVSSQLIF